MIGKSYIQRLGELPAAQRWMIGVLAVALALASIDPPYPETSWLHHAPTLALVIAAPWLLARWRLSNAAVASILLFWLLHTLGGRYTYSNVPYDEWATSLTGHDLSGLLGATRNHYDRLVHFAFGALATRPVMELCGRRRWHGAAIALGFVLAGGAAYEIFEWLLTLVAAGPQADAYNGQQGDIWDAQKDMALAAIGCLAAAALSPGMIRGNRATGY